MRGGCARVRGRVPGGEVGRRSGYLPRILAAVGGRVPGRDAAGARAGTATPCRVAPRHTRPVGHAACHHRGSPEARPTPATHLHPAGFAPPARYVRFRHSIPPEDHQADARASVPGARRRAPAGRHEAPRARRSDFTVGPRNSCRKAAGLGDLACTAWESRRIRPAAPWGIGTSSDSRATKLLRRDADLGRNRSETHVATNQRTDVRHGTSRTFDPRGTGARLGRIRATGGTGARLGRIGATGRETVARVSAWERGSG